MCRKLIEDGKVNLKLNRGGDQYHGEHFGMFWGPKQRGAVT